MVQLTPSGYRLSPLAPHSHGVHLAQPANPALAFHAPLPWGGHVQASMAAPVAKQFVDGLIVVGLAGVLVWGAVEYAKSRA